MAYRDRVIYRDEAGNRVWSAVQFVIAAVTLLIAFGAFPTSEKGIAGWAIAIALMLVGILSLVTFLTGRALNGRRALRRPRFQRIAFIVLAVVSPILIIVTAVNNINGTWTAFAVLTIGLWASLFCFALSLLPIANAQLRQVEG
jgi:hypothetical protein